MNSTSGTADQKYHLKCFISSDLAWTWWKMIDLHPSNADQNHHLKLFYSSDSSLDMVKDDWPATQVLQTTISPIFFFNFRFSLDMWWKMIDSLQVLQTRNLTYNVLWFRFSLDMVKEDWTLPWYCREEYASNIFVHSDIAWTWWKMIELHPGTANQKYNLYIFLHFKFSLDMAKDDWTLPSGTADKNIT